MSPIERKRETGRQRSMQDQSVSVHLIISAWSKLKSRVARLDRQQLTVLHEVRFARRTLFFAGGDALDTEVGVNEDLGSTGRAKTQRRGKRTVRTHNAHRPCRCQLST